MYTFTRWSMYSWAEAVSGGNFPGNEGDLGCGIELVMSESLLLTMLPKEDLFAILSPFILWELYSILQESSEIYTQISRNEEVGFKKRIQNRNTRFILNSTCLHQEMKGVDCRKWVHTGFLKFTQTGTRKLGSWKFFLANGIQCGNETVNLHWETAWEGIRGQRKRRKV